MEKKPGTFGSLFENAGDYLETRLELLKLQAIDKTSDVTSSVVSGITLAIIMGFAFFLINIGIALWIGELLDKAYLGFFILAAFYLLAGFLVRSFKKAWIKDPITTMLIKKMLN